MNKKLKVIMKVSQNVEKKFPESKDFVEQNMKEVCEREHISVEEVIYFAFFVFMMYVCTGCLIVF